MVEVVYNGTVCVHFLYLERILRRMLENSNDAKEDIQKYRDEQKK